MKKHTLLKGEGVNQHTLYGNFDVQEFETTHINVKSISHLKHEEPDGSYAEHNTLVVDKGEWVQGRQVEFNPFEREITQIWD